LRIDPRTGAVAATPSQTARARSAAGPRFELATARTAPSGAAHAAAPLATLDAILMLQNEDEAGGRRRRSARRGRDILDGLDRLKAGLLAGSVPTADLAALARDLADREPSGDPGLDAILDEVELRARVELAKLGQPDPG
jgi:hypothetical protein